MAFSLSSATSKELVLIRRAWNAPLLLAATGTLFLLGAAIYQTQLTRSLVALLPFGLTMVAAALFWLFASNHRSIPNMLRFLVAEGVVEVSARSGRVRMTLGDLESITVARRNRGRYAVSLTFADGSFWDLDYFAFQRPALRLKRSMEAITAAARSAKSERTQRVSGSELFSQSKDGNTIFWRERFSAATLFAANLLLLGITMAAIGFAYQQKVWVAPSMFLLGVYGLLQLVGLVASIGALFMRHEIRITEQSIEFRTKMLSGKKETELMRKPESRPPELRFARNVLAALTLSLEPDRGVHRLRLLTPDDLSDVESLRKPGLGLLRRWKLHRRVNATVRIPLFGLDFASALMLREALAKRTRG